MQKVIVAATLILAAACGGAEGSTVPPNVGATGTGGVEGLGGSPYIETGGEEPSGGSADTGGSETGGTQETGGEEPSGGSAPETGGTTPTGGIEETGGNTETGGISATGGVEETGGTPTGGSATGGAETGGSGTGGDGTGGGDPVPECTGDEVVCEGQTLRTCVDGFWDDRECPYACGPHYTGRLTCVGTCVPGTTRCLSTISQSCDDLGNWQNEEVCPFVCSGAGTCTGECVPGTQQCNVDGDAETCNDDGAWEVETCTNACVDGACTGVCSPGEEDCLGDTPRTCNGIGTWVEGTECEFVCSGAGNCTGECVPGTTECSGNGTRTCGDDGWWGSVTACPEAAHEVASCSAGVCSVSCEAGWDDCTSAPGCESDLTALGTCGSCALDCNGNPAHAAPICTVDGCGMICDETWGDVNGDASDGCEGDIYNDPENCGAVGNSCYGGQCLAGVCEFDVEEIASWEWGIGNNAYPVATVLDGGYLYLLLDQGDIYKVATDGTSVDVLASGAGYTSRNNLVVEGGYLYWVDDGKHGELSGIYRLSTDGGTPTRLGGWTPLRIDVENDRVYWLDEAYLEYNDHPVPNSSERTTLWGMPVTGGVRTAELELAGTFYAYFKVMNSAITLVRVKTFVSGANTIDLLAFDLTESFAIPLNGTVTRNGKDYFLSERFYGWTFTKDYLFIAAGEDWRSGDTSYNKYSRRISLTDAQPHLSNVALPQTLGGEGGGQPMVADDSYLYYQSGYAVARIPINGGTAEQMTPYYDWLSGIAIDDTYLYSISRESCDSLPCAVRVLRTLK